MLAAVVMWEVLILRIVASSVVRNEGNESDNS